MNIDDILTHDAFRGFSEEKIALYRNLAMELEGKSTMECMGILLEYQKKISSLEPFTKEEQAAVWAVLEQSLSPEDKKKLSQIMKMMGSI